MNTDNLCRNSEAARLTGRGLSTLRKLAAHGGFLGVPALKVGRDWFWPRAELLAAVAERSALPPSGKEG